MELPNGGQKIIDIESGEDCQNEKRGDTTTRLKKKKSPREPRKVRR